MIRSLTLSSITHSGFVLELMAKDVQNSYYRELSAACNSKINPAFAWVYDHADAYHFGGKFLNTVPSLDSAIIRESTGTVRAHIPGSILQEFYRLQVKHLV